MRSAVQVVRVLLLSLAYAMALAAQSPAGRSPIPGAPAGVTAFVDVTVIPMDSERVLPHQTVVVQGGWVTALGPINKVKVPKGAVKINAEGRYLMPGLADMWTDVGMGRADLGFDSAAVDGRLFLWLANGITAIRNMVADPKGGWPSQSRRVHEILDGPELLRLRARAAAGTLWSPRIYTSGYFGPPRDSIDSTIFRPELPLATIASQLTAYKAMGYDFLTIMWQWPRQNSAEDPVKDSLVATARRLNLPIDGVVQYTPLAQALYSYRSLSELGGYTGSAAVLQGALDLDPTATPQSLAAATARAGTWNCPALAGSQTLVYRKVDWVYRHRMEPRWKMVKALQEAGAGLLLCTGGSSSMPLETAILHPAPDARPASPYAPPDSLERKFDWLYGNAAAVHQELGLLVQHGGLTPYQALVTGTRGAARFLGMETESGTVAVGKRADLVLLTDNPLESIAHAQHVAGVMAGGRWLSRADIDQQVAAMKHTLAAKGGPWPPPLTPLPPWAPEGELPGQWDYWGAELVP